MQEVKFFELRKHIPYQAMLYLLLMVTYSTLKAEIVI